MLPIGAADVPDYTGVVEMARGVAMAAAILSVGCYAYRPLEQPTPAAGAEVRATLATPRNVQLGEIVVQDVNRIEGLVYQASGDSVVISGTWVYTRLGSRYAANGGAFYLTRPELGTPLEVRRVSPARTGIAGLMTVGVVAAMFAGVKQALGGGGPPPPPSDGN
jgi:hypothetical protein